MTDIFFNGTVGEAFWGGRLSQLVGVTDPITVNLNSGGSAASESGDIFAKLREYSNIRGDE